MRKILRSSVSVTLAIFTILWATCSGIIWGSFNSCSEYSAYQPTVSDSCAMLDSVDTVKDDLRDFWMRTGLQPVVATVAWTEMVSTPHGRQEWTEAALGMLPDNCVAIVYFAAQNPNQVGTIKWFVGDRVKQICPYMDMSVVEGEVSRLWFTKISTDRLFVELFNAIADSGVRQWGAPVHPRIVSSVMFCLSIVSLSVLMLLNEKKKK